MNCSPTFSTLNTTLQILAGISGIIFFFGLVLVVWRLIEWFLEDERPVKEAVREQRGSIATTVIAALVVGGTLWGSMSISFPFNDWSTYTAQYPVLATAQPVIRGKILVVQTASSSIYSDTGGGEYRNDPSLTDRSKLNTSPPIDGSFCEFPDALRATSDREVGTVIWMEWSRVIYAYYCEEGSQSFVNGESSCGTQSEAYALSCQISIIDLKEKGIVYQHTYTGSTPETPQSYSSTSGAYDLTGSSPIPEIVAFVVSLPRTP